MKHMHITIAIISTWMIVLFSSEPVFVFQKNSTIFFDYTRLDLQAQHDKGSLLFEKGEYFIQSTKRQNKQINPLLAISKEDAFKIIQFNWNVSKDAKQIVTGTINETETSFIIYQNFKLTMESSFEPWNESPLQNVIYLNIHTCNQYYLECRGYEDRENTKDIFKLEARNKQNPLYNNLRIALSQQVPIFLLMTYQCDNVKYQIPMCVNNVISKITSETVFVCDIQLPDKSDKSSEHEQAETQLPQSWSIKNTTIAKAFVAFGAIGISLFLYMLSK